MKKLLLYPSEHPDDHVVYIFDVNGIIQAFEIHKKMTEEQFESFRKSLPYTEAALHLRFAEIKQRYPKSRLIEGAMDLSFDNFWKQWCYHGGHVKDRLRAQSKWNALSEKDRIMAITYVPKYIRECKDLRVNIKYAKTYLSPEEKPWLD